MPVPVTDTAAHLTNYRPLRKRLHWHNENESHVLQSELASYIKQLSLYRRAEFPHEDWQHPVRNDDIATISIRHRCRLSVVSDVSFDSEVVLESICRRHSTSNRHRREWAESVPHKEARDHPEMTDSFIRHYYLH